MEMNKCENRYSSRCPAVDTKYRREGEVRERAVRMVFEHQDESDSQSAAIKSRRLYVLG